MTRQLGPTTSTAATPDPESASVRLVEVPWSHADAARMRAALRAEIAQRYGGTTPGFRLAAEIEPGDAVAAVVAAVVAYDGGDPVGHVALRVLGDDLEVKRLYVAPRVRRTGLGVLLPRRIQQRAATRPKRRLVLHTRHRQPEAVALYLRLGYQPIPVLAPYTHLPGSRCSAKPNPAAGAGDA